MPALLALGTTAYAYWTAAGVGDGEVGVQTAAPLTLTGDSAVTGQLYPGATSDVAFSVANTNAYAVTLTTLVAATITSSDELGCPGATYLVLAEPVRSALVSGSAPLPEPIPVPADSVATAASVPGLVVLAMAAPDACQGVTFTLALELAGSQA